MPPGIIVGATFTAQELRGAPPYSRGARPYSAPSLSQSAESEPEAEAGAETTPDLPDLSSEVLEAVFLQLKSRNDMLACQRVCRKWAGASRRAIWQHVVLPFNCSGGRRVLDLLHLLIVRPDLACLVRSLSWGPLELGDYANLWQIEGNWTHETPTCATALPPLVLLYEI